MSLRVKICGLSTAETLDAALQAGADLIGLVFHPKSPRYVPLERARDLAAQARGQASVVALVVDADDATLDAIHAAVSPDVWQAHGSETTDRLAVLRARYGTPILKAIGWSSRDDAQVVRTYQGKADYILLDAKPPQNAAYPGGHGQPFDWMTLDVLPPELSFLLSGGLTPETVTTAIHTVRALGVNLCGVDVSSGVESAPGVKDIAKIRAFVAAARAAG